MSSALRYRIELPVGNEWDNVDRIRESILACFAAMFAQPEMAWHSFATVASELMENAMKYGRWLGTGKEFLQLRLWGDAEWAYIEVEHPVDGSSDDVRDLLETLDWLRGFPSAAEAYRQRVLAVAEGPLGVSRLGLARIAYETECQLSAELVDDRLSVRGVARLSP